ncbi:hypothetical protein [Rana esculenta virus]|uniref:40 kDa protein n=1 Tax=Rana esculenta virus TaxID=575980 RepID=A0A222NTU4_9VIRU|nr:hypothetical protein [Rana esculenta virus]
MLPQNSQVVHRVQDGPPVGPQPAQALLKVPVDVRRQAQAGPLAGVEPRPRLGVGAHHTPGVPVPLILGAVQHVHLLPGPRGQRLGHPLDVVHPLAQHQPLYVGPDEHPVGQGGVPLGVLGLGLDHRVPVHLARDLAKLGLYVHARAEYLHLVGPGADPVHRAVLPAEKCPQRRVVVVIPHGCSAQTQQVRGPHRQEDPTRHGGRHLVGLIHNQEKLCGRVLGLDPPVSQRSRTRHVQVPGQGVGRRGAGCKDPRVRKEPGRRVPPLSRQHPPVCQDEGWQPQPPPQLQGHEGLAEAGRALEHAVPLGGDVAPGLLQDPFLVRSWRDGAPLPGGAVSGRRFASQDPGTPCEGDVGLSPGREGKQVRFPRAGHVSIYRVEP